MMRAFVEGGVVRTVVTDPKRPGYKTSQAFEVDGDEMRWSIATEDAQGEAAVTNFLLRQ